MKYILNFSFSFVIYVCLLFGNSSCKSQDVAVNKTVVPDTLRAKIIIAGDVMGHMPQINSAWVDSINSYDFNPVYEYVTNYISKADLAVANLEVPLAGKPYSGYPQFSSPDEHAIALKANGFDALIMANNHVIDRWKKGAIRTLNLLDSLNLKHAGVYRDTAEKRKHYPLFIEINKIKIALLNYTYGTNGLVPEKPLIINYIDTTAIKRDLAVCRKQKAEIILATIHWGTEYERYSTKEQRVIAQFMARNGVHSIIGSHPHVVEPFNLLYPYPPDSTYAVPIIYSVGNFVSNQRDRYRDGGVIFEINIEKTNSAEITSTGFVPVWVYKGWFNEKIIYKLIPPAKFNEASLKYKINSADSAKCTQFYTDTREHLGNLTEIIVTE